MNEKFTQNLMEPINECIGFSAWNPCYSPSFCSSGISAAGIYNNLSADTDVFPDDVASGSVSHLSVSGGDNLQSETENQILSAYVDEEAVQGLTVSSGDSGSFSSSDFSVIHDDIQQCNYLLTAVLFFLIFMWAEKKIRTAVRSFTGRGIE